MTRYGAPLCLHVVMLILVSVKLINAEGQTQDFLGLRSPRGVEPFNIELPAQRDVDAMIEFDRSVAFEFFKPLFKKAYSSYDFGKNPDVYLNQDLEQDKVRFAAAIEGRDKFKSYIARGRESGKIIGLILIIFHDSETVMIDLLIVAKSARGSGVGMALIEAARNSCKGLKKMVVCPFSLGNEATLKFYERAGFTYVGSYHKDGLNAYGAPYKEIYAYYEMNLKQEKIDDTKAGCDSNI